jgi:hypothetical protein
MLIARTPGVIASKGQRPPSRPAIQTSGGRQCARRLFFCAGRPPVGYLAAAASTFRGNIRSLSPARCLHDGGALFLVEIHDARAQPDGAGAPDTAVSDEADAYQD